MLRYTLPSRYCDSDKLLNFAWDHFGRINNGLEKVQAICDWIHKNFEYRYFSGSPELSAADALARGYGVCRDFAHIGVALCRAFNLPARYVTGHLPDIGCADTGMDFHAYMEVYLGQDWFTFDPRFNVPRIGRVKIAQGLDAVDGASPRFMARPGWIILKSGPTSEPVAGFRGRSHRFIQTAGWYRGSPFKLKL